MGFVAGALTACTFLAHGWPAWACGALALVFGVLYAGEEMREADKVRELKRRIHELASR